MPQALAQAGLEAPAHVEVLDAHSSEIVDAAEGWERLLWAVSNVLAGNPITNPAVRVGGRIEVRASVPTLAAVAGDCDVYVGGVRARPWRAVPLPPGSTVRVEARGGSAYLALRGLRARALSVGRGLRLLVSAVTGFEDVVARYVPESLLRAFESNGTTVDELIHRVARHVHLACEMVRSGAKLIKVRVGNAVYEMWVKEVE